MGLKVSFQSMSRGYRFVPASTCRLVRLILGGKGDLQRGVGLCFVREIVVPLKNEKGIGGWRCAFFVLDEGELGVCPKKALKSLHDQSIRLINQVFCYPSIQMQSLSGKVY